MRLLYGIINFALLVAIITLCFRKTIREIFRKYRLAVEKDLQAAQDGKAAAERLHTQLLQNEAQSAAAMEALRKESENLITMARAEQSETQRAMAEHQEKKLRHYTENLTLDMLEQTRGSAVCQVAKKTRELLQKEPYVSAMRGREAAIAAAIRRLVSISAGDRVYLLKQDVLYVTLTSAFPLDEVLQQQFCDTATQLLAAEGYRPSFWVRTDPDLIGGLKLRIGDTVYDGTIQNLLINIVRYLDFLPPKPDDGMPEFVHDIEGKITKLPDNIDIYQRGRVVRVSDGICWLDGLADIMYGELVEFECGARGMVLDIERDRIGCIVFGGFHHIEELSTVRRLGKEASVPVGPQLLGRIVDPLGIPLDGRGNIHASQTFPIEHAAPAILERKSVCEPLYTGLTAIDALVPIGRGQRELIIGDRQTGKTAVAVDAIINQRGKDVICIYVAIGQKESTVAAIRDKLERFDAMDYTIVVSASAFQSAPMQYIAPYAGTSMGEYFMRRGKHVLIVYDDLSKHAVAYREISLLLHRPPGREAYPGDIFYLHSRLLERSAKLSDELGGGSMTALPIIETLAGDIASFIPTNVISITDGQIFLDADLFHAGQRPAVNVGLSVSRVGGAAQIQAMRQISSRLRMDLAQYRELLSFAQFGTEIDNSTRTILTHGDRMMAMLAQPPYSPLPVQKQVLSILAVSGGHTDHIPLEKIAAFRELLFSHFELSCQDILLEIANGEKMGDELLSRIHTELRTLGEAF